MVLKAQAANGEVRHAEGVTWTYAGDGGEAMLLFPRLALESAGPVLDEIAQYYAERRPEQLVGCWSLDPPQPADLEVRLLARGFQPGWQPRWMWLDLNQTNEDHPRPADLEITPVEEEAAWEVRDLPYHSKPMAAVRHAATRLQPNESGTLPHGSAVSR